MRRFRPAIAGSMALVLIAIISLGITPAFADHGVNGHEVLGSSANLVKQNDAVRRGI
jgi:hypothetical protein